MLNKIVVLIFTGMLLVTSTVALASDNEKINDSTKIVSIIDYVSNLNVEKQTPNIGSVKNQLNVLRDSSKSDPSLPVNGWLLTMVLFGFVMLSNRSGV